MSSLLSIREAETKLKDLGFDIDFSEVIDVLIPNISAEIQVYED
jgi:hypothetical protein